MCVQTVGSNMSNNPLDFFERSIRPIEESSGPIPDLQIDKLLGFSDSEGDRLYSALTDRYPAGPWTNYGSGIQPKRPCSCYRPGSACSETSALKTDIHSNAAPALSMHRLYRPTSASANLTV